MLNEPYRSLPRDNKISYGMDKSAFVGSPWTDLGSLDPKELIFSFWGFLIILGIMWVVEFPEFTLAH